MTRFLARVIRAFQKHERKSPPEPDPGRTLRTKKTASSEDQPEPRMPGPLGAGFYTAGIDIPAGELLLRPVEGQGELRSGSECCRLGMSEPDFYSSEPRRIHLHPGESIEIYGTLLLEPEADAPDWLSTRDYRPEESIELGAGHYFSGVDFDPGTYRIEAKDGHGFIDFFHEDSPSDCYLGVDDEKRLWYIPRIDNVRFRENAYLNVSDALCVSLIPEHESPSRDDRDVSYTEDLERSLA